MSAATEDARTRLREAQLRGGKGSLDNGVPWEKLTLVRVDDLAALLAPPAAVDGWRIDRGSANSHVFDDQLLFGDECVGFVDADWSDRILTMLAAAPTPPAASPPAPSALVEDGYQLAFYELAGLMGIGARSASPGHVWRSEMLPKIAAALAHHSAQPASDEGPCTDCYDTGITIQTERRCACQTNPQPVSEGGASK